MITRKVTILAAVALASVTSASAIIFDFENLSNASILTDTKAYTDFDPVGAGGVGSPYALNNDWVSSRTDLGVFGGSLSWVKGGLSVTATALYSNGTTESAVSVIQDHDGGGKAGLGVYHLQGDTSDDNVTGTGTGNPATTFETLVLTFDQQVTITGLSFRNANHNALNSGSYLLNSGSGFGEATFGGPVSTTGSVFKFQYGGTSPDQFYLSTLTATPAPDGGITMVLLGLALTGLAVAKRRIT